MKGSVPPTKSANDVAWRLCEFYAIYAVSLVRIERKKVKGAWKMFNHVRSMTNQIQNVDILSHLFK